MNGVVYLRADEVLRAELVAASSIFVGTDDRQNAEYVTYVISKRRMGLENSVVRRQGTTQLPDAYLLRLEKRFTTQTMNLLGSHSLAGEV